MKSDVIVRILDVISKYDGGLSIKQLSLFFIQLSDEFLDGRWGRLCEWRCELESKWFV